MPHAQREIREPIARLVRGVAARALHPARMQEDAIMTIRLTTVQSTLGAGLLAALLLASPTARAGAASDAWITAQVKFSLLRGEGLRAFGIHVDTRDADVLLHGHVPSGADVATAGRLARAVTGVRDVHDRLQVEPPDRDPDVSASDADLAHESPGSESSRFGRVTSKVGDAWITTAATAKLVAKGEPALGIDVDTRRGEVTLFGTVDSEQQKDDAGAVVLETDGVRSLRNELQVVEPAQRDAVARRDREVATALERQLRNLRGMPSADIEVQVENGVARLKGKVDAPEDRIAALSVAGATEGVRSVMADLELREN